MDKNTPEIALTQVKALPYWNLNEDSGKRSILDLETQNSLKISFYPSKRYYGRNYVFCWKNNQPRCTLGPHWYLFAITWILIEAAGIYFYTQLTQGSSIYLKLGAIALIIWQGFIYMLTALKNPGIVAAENPNDPNLANCTNNPYFCPKCKIIRDKDTMHCDECNVCIEGFDHHCPWTGKCIGKGNLIPFYAFLVSTIVYLVFFMVVGFERLPNV